MTLPKGVEETVCRDEVPAMLDYAARHLTEKGYMSICPDAGQNPGRNAGTCWRAKARKTT